MKLDPVSQQLYTFMNNSLKESEGKRTGKEERDEFKIRAQAVVKAFLESSAKDRVKILDSVLAVRYSKTEEYYKAREIIDDIRAGKISAEEDKFLGELLGSVNMLALDALQTRLRNAPLPPPEMTPQEKFLSEAAFAKLEIDNASSDVSNRAPYADPDLEEEQPGLGDILPPDEPELQPGLVESPERGNRPIPQWAQQATDEGVNPNQPQESLRKTVAEPVFIPDEDVNPNPEEPASDNLSKLLAAGTTSRLVRPPGQELQAFEQRFLDQAIFPDESDSLSLEDREDASFSAQLEAISLNQFDEFLLRLKENVSSPEDLKKGFARLEEEIGKISNLNTTAKLLSSLKAFRQKHNV